MSALISINSTLWQAHFPSVVAPTSKVSKVSVSVGGHRRIISSFAAVWTYSAHVCKKHQTMHSSWVGFCLKEESQAPTWISLTNGNWTKKTTSQ